MRVRRSSAECHASPRCRVTLKLQNHLQRKKKNTSRIKLHVPAQKSSGFPQPTISPHMHAHTNLAALQTKHLVRLPQLHCRQFQAMSHCCHQAGAPPVADAKSCPSRDSVAMALCPRRLGRTQHSMTCSGFAWRWESGGGERMKYEEAGRIG